MIEAVLLFLGALALLVWVVIGLAIIWAGGTINRALDQIWRR